jgi:predicted CoA-binding protein
VGRGVGQAPPRLGPARAVSAGGTHGAQSALIMTSAFDDIAGFLALKRIALIGASLSPKHVSRTVLRELALAGYDVVPVNLRASPGDMIDGHVAYAHVGDIARNAPPAAGAILMVPPNAATGVVAECAAVGVMRLWFYRGMGTGVATDDSIRAASELGVKAVVGECPLMFLPNAKLCPRSRGAVKKLCGAWPRRGATALRATTPIVVILAILQLLVGAAALAVGALLVANPDGTPLGASITIPGHAPFETFRFPGLALLVLGLGHVAGSLVTLRRRPNAGAVAAWLAMALALGVVVQCLWVSTSPALAGTQVAAVGAALGEVACAVVWLRHMTPRIHPLSVAS